MIFIGKSIGLVKKHVTKSLYEARRNYLYWENVRSLFNKFYDRDSDMILMAEYNKHKWELVIANIKKQILPNFAISGGPV